MTKQTLTVETYGPRTLEVELDTKGNVEIILDEEAKNYGPDEARVTLNIKEATELRDFLNKHLK